MPSTKEAGSASFHPSETLRQEQNSFLRFIGENKDLFERHSSLTYELRDEEEGWRNSSTVDQIVNNYIELVSPIFPNTITNKRLHRVSREIKRNILKTLLRSRDEKDNLTEQQSRNALFSTRKFNNLQVSAINALYDRVDEFNRDFHEAKAPIVAEVQGSKAELSSKFKNYLLSDPNSIFAFRDFLLDKNCAPNREVIRPFLASFAQSEDRLVKDGKGGVLGETVKEWVGEISEKATPDILDEFVASIKSPNILEWLKFSAAFIRETPRIVQAPDQDSIAEENANVLKLVPDFSAWPSELRRAFESFVASKYHSTLGVIRKELDQFRKPLTQKGLTQPYDFLGEETGTVSVEAAIEKKPDNQKVTLKQTEREKYPVGILTIGDRSWFEVRVLAEEELTHRLQKRADSLAPADQRMIADLEKIFLSLREDPYGLGTQKLQDRFIVVGHKELPLRSLNPGKRIGLSHDHPDSHDIRIVYVIYKNNGIPAIGLEGVYRHDDYMSRFKFGK